jgi:hypothetical protein
LDAELGALEHLHDRALVTISEIDGSGFVLCCVLMPWVAVCFSKAPRSSWGYRTVLSIFVWPSKSWTARRLPVRR